MKFEISTAAIAALLLAGPAAAQQFVGGTAALGYVTTDEADADGYDLSLSGETAFSRQISVQGDLNYARIDIDDGSGDIGSVGLHAIYRANEFASFGVFAGNDRLNTDAGSDSASYYGVEGGYGANNVKMSGYMAVSTLDASAIDTGLGIDEIDLTRLGFNVAYLASARATVTARYDQVRFTDGLSANRIGLGVDTAVAPNVDLSIEVGQIDLDLLGYGGDDTYASATVTYSFGAQERGTTFAQRGLVTSLLGF